MCVCVYGDRVCECMCVYVEHVWRVCAYVGVCVWKVYGWHVEGVCVKGGV